MHFGIMYALIEPCAVHALCAFSLAHSRRALEHPAPAPAVAAFGDIPLWTKT